MPEYNGAMMQFFHWHTPADGSLWRSLTEQAAGLAAAGFTSLWLPPAYKGASGNQDRGYGVYDLFDLGEFDQKGTVGTKYGTRDEYLQAIRAAQQAGLRVYADVVLNHKLGGDQEEEFRATPYHPDNRNDPIGELQPIRAWTHFTFPGRRGKYSELEWHWWHFNAVDVNAMAGGDTPAVYLFEGKQFQSDVDREKGNFDYLMGCNLDIENPDVQKELYHWGEWYLETTGVDGFRFDAVKHVRAGFFVEWLNHLRGRSGRDLFAVGEYWGGVDQLKQFIETTGGQIRLFDAGLHYRFAAAGREGRDFDLQTLFEGSLVKDHPDQAVTMVSNHDTQPLQTLESVVEPWFKPLAYALILLRQGGYPCVFAADYYGARYKGKNRKGRDQEVRMPSHRWVIDRFLEARRSQAFGEQRDYFDDAHCVGWTCSGDEGHPGGLAVLLSNDGDGRKAMQTGSPETTYIDHTKHVGETVVTDGDGWGEFRCRDRSVSLWLPEKKQ